MYVLVPGLVATLGAGEDRGVVAAVVALAVATLGAGEGRGIVAAVVALAVATLGAGEGRASGDRRVSGRGWRP